MISYFRATHGRLLFMGLHIAALGTARQPRHTESVGLNDWI
jgi:hypothetical protein